MRQEVIQKAPEQPKKQTPNLTGIPTQMKLDFERRSGLSFDDVRVHYNSDKPRKIGALAYTQGTQVHIGPGQERHLRHELGHVVQQKTSIVKPTKIIHNIPVNTDQNLEKHATQFSLGQFSLIPNRLSTNSTVQMYSIEQLSDGCTYFVSRNRKLMCKAAYPNHYFYTSVSFTLDSGVIGSGDSIIYITQVPGLAFNGYSKWTAKYVKKDEIKVKNDAIKTLRKHLLLPSRHKESYSEAIKCANALKHRFETFRKLVVGYAVLNNSSATPYFETAKEIYQAFSILFNSPSKITNVEAIFAQIDRVLRKNTQQSYEMLRGNANFLTFHMCNIGLVDSWCSFRETMTELMKAGKSPSKRLVKALNYAYFIEQETSEEPLLARGCDLVKAFIASPSDKKDPDKYQKLSKYFLSSTDYSSSNPGLAFPHHSTIVASDGDDFICIEGYANKNFKFFDNSWEFVMYGSPTLIPRRKKIDSFSSATTYRHMLMHDTPASTDKSREWPSFQDFELRLPQVFKHLKLHKPIY